MKNVISLQVPNNVQDTREVHHSLGSLRYFVDDFFPNASIYHVKPQ